MSKQVRRGADRTSPRRRDAAASIRVGDAMFHHLNPYITNEHARARIADVQSAIAERAVVEQARAAWRGRRRRRRLAGWTIRPLPRLRPRLR
jgi:hypothetical protein